MLDKGEGKQTRKVIPEGMTREIVTFLRAIFGEKMRSVIVYGSYARGDFDEESDIDIAVLLDMPRDEIKHFRADVVSLASRLSLKYAKLVSIVEIPESEYDAYRVVLPFYRNIDKEGVALDVA